MNISKTVKRAISVMIVFVCMLSLAACRTTENKMEKSEFPQFKGTDFEGNEVDETMFSDNNVTVVNFWFNECSACVDEMQVLDSFNHKLKEKGVELVGINVEAGKNKDVLEQAKKILKEQGATFRNVVISEGDEAKEYMSDITVFPTTILVDSEGKIVENPIQGSIDNEENMKKIESMINEICKK